MDSYFSRPTTSNNITQSSSLSRLSVRKQFISYDSKNIHHQCSLYDLLDQCQISVRSASASRKARQRSKEKAEAFIQHFQTLVARHFSCPICQCIAHEPVALACSHLFCRTCLDEWVSVLESKGEMKSCPVCRHAIRLELNMLHGSTMSINFGLNLFLTKVAALQKFFRQQEEEQQQSEPRALECQHMATLLNILGISYNFRSVESMHNMSVVSCLPRGGKGSQERSLVTQRRTDLYHIIRQLRLSKNSALSVHKFIRPSQWQLFRDRLTRTMRMICPGPVRYFFEVLVEYVALIPWLSSCRCIWVKPKSEFYYCLLFSLLFWYLVWAFGPRILRLPAVRVPVKRLLEHAVFICFDGPTFELVNVIHEAFVAPI